MKIIGKRPLVVLGSTKDNQLTRLRDGKIFKLTSKFVPLTVFTELIGPNEHDEYRMGRFVILRHGAFNAPKSLKEVMSRYKYYKRKYPDRYTGHK